MSADDDVEKFQDIVLCSHRIPQGIVLKPGYVLEVRPVTGPEGHVFSFSVVAVHESQKAQGS